MTDVLALLVTAISVFNIATMMVNLKLYTEFMKEKSQRERVSIVRLPERRAPSEDK